MGKTRNLESKQGQEIIKEAVGSGSIEHTDDWSTQIRHEQAVKINAVLNRNGKNALTPEQKEMALRDFGTLFKSRPELHDGIDWNSVKIALEADEKALLSVKELIDAGHEPNVFDTNEDWFDIGTCSIETPLSTRNCVYDRKAADRVRNCYPDEEFNGSAEEQAKVIGVELMGPVKYRKKLQTKGKFDDDLCTWLKTTNKIRKSGVANYGGRRGNDVYVDQDHAYIRSDFMGWRGSKRVKWVKKEKAV